MDGIEDTSTTSISEDEKLLAEEESAPVKPPAPKTSAKSTPEPKEEEAEEEIEEESEEEPEEEPEPEKVLDTIYTRPSIAEIKGKYPDLFKDFPSLRDVYFRERAFNELFSSVEEAKEANENDGAFRTLREDIFNGDGTKLFAALKQDGETLNKFSASLLPTLFKASPEAHWKAVTPLLENIVRTMHAEGESKNIEDLKNASLHISNFLFGGTEVAEGKKTFVEKAPDNSVREERQKFEAERFNSFSSDLESTAVSSLRSLVEKNLDPDGIMTPFIKNNIIRETITAVDAQLTADKAHMRGMESLNRKAKENNYSSEYKSKIISAYLERAKSLVPSVRAKFVSEAMGTSKKVADNKLAKADAAKSRVDKTAGSKLSSDRATQYDPKKINWGKTSDEDILNGNVTTK